VIHHSGVDDRDTIIAIFNDKKDAFDFLYSLSDEIVLYCKVVFIVYKGTDCVPLKPKDE